MVIRMIRKDDYTFNIGVLQEGAAFNLTGCTVYMTAKYSYSDADGSAVFQLSTSGGQITVTNAAGGLATIAIPSSATSSLANRVTHLLFDIQVVTGASKRHTVMRGTLIVNPEVTDT